MEDRPTIGSQWRHADGGLYKVTGFRNHKCRMYGYWYLAVEYEHNDGNRHPNGLGYSTDLTRWHDRFTEIL
jgi:hypothetical protein